MGVNNTVSGGIQTVDESENTFKDGGLKEERKNHEETELELSKRFPGLSMPNKGNAEEIDLDLDDLDGEASPLKQRISRSPSPQKMRN
jgi:hypothetical protein